MYRKYLLYIFDIFIIKQQINKFAIYKNILNFGEILKKFKLNFSFLVFLVLVPYNLFSYNKNTCILVKLKDNHHFDKLKIQLENNFSNISIKQLINPKLLDYPNNFLFRNSNPNSQNRIEKLSNSLRRTYEICLNTSLEKTKVIKLVSTFPEVELAELYPEREICAIPNDSLFSEQFYMNLLRVTEAWDTLSVRRPILVSVVDTGVDYTHPDLAENIWNNPGEIGLDNEGNDKRSNGIDDDNNGFVDDWRGWDFLSSTSENGYDNDPFPGHSHGTHVAGTIAAIINNEIGIAGMCDSIKILPVKIGDDNSMVTSLRNSYEGLLYSAKMGADIINCSWGGTSHSIIEQEVIDLATELGSCVVAAAGNNNSEIGFYPASYNNVLSVAATDDQDRKAYFSNFYGAVDIAAPGIDIISTIVGGNYAKWRGTSMATPIVSGVAAMVKMLYPNYTPIQLQEHLKATSIKIDSLNQQFIGKLGNGRVDALRAVTATNPKSILVKDLTIKEKNPDGRFLSNDECYIDLILENYLSKITNLLIKIEALDFPQVSFKPETMSVGQLATNERINLSNAFEFNLPTFEKTDLRFSVKLAFYDGEELITYAITSIFVNPSYLTFDNNRITTTFNSRGNIGFNDYPSNEQGIGFSFDHSPNILFEGSLMIAYDTLVADVARNEKQLSQNRGFATTQKIDFLPTGNPIMLAGTTFYKKTVDAFPNISIKQWIYQPKQPDNVIYTIYDVINNEDYVIDSLYLGLYFDWDIGISGVDNIAQWDEKEQFGFVRNTMVDSLPVVGIKQLTDFANQFWAIDNDGVTDENPGVWDGFYNTEKIRMLKSGIGRAKSNLTDVSVVTGAGPIFLEAKDTARVTFAIISDKNLESLNKSIAPAINYASSQNLINGNVNKPIEKSKILSVYPNPLRPNSAIWTKFQLSEESNVSIYLYDILGNKTEKLLEGKYPKSKYLTQIYVPNLAAGAYFLVFRANNNLETTPIIIER